MKKKIYFKIKNVYKVINTYLFLNGSIDTTDHNNIMILINTGGFFFFLVFIAFFILLPQNPISWYA